MDYKTEISNTTGIPAELLRGETQEAMVAYARELLAFRNTLCAYPVVKDGGEVDSSALPDPRPAREQFADFFGKAVVFDHF